MDDETGEPDGRVRTMTHGLAAGTRGKGRTASRRRAAGLLAAVSLAVSAIVVGLPATARADGLFAAPTTYVTGSGPADVTTADLHGQGDDSLAVANTGDGTVSVLVGKGDGGFQPSTPYLSGPGPSGVRSGDLRGNGTADLVVANQYDATVSVLLGNGDGTFGPPQPYVTGPGPSAVTSDDLNGDGADDLIVANQYDATVTVLLTTGHRAAPTGAAQAAGAGSTASRCV